MTVSGGGQVNTANDTGTDSTIILVQADLTVTSTHSGNFTRGQIGATYTLTVFNAAAGGPVFAGNHGDGVDTLPAGITATAISGPGWTCTLATLTCTRSDFLSANSNYSQITVTVNVAGNAATPLVNSVTVSGGGQVNTANDTGTDSTVILVQADLTVTKTHSGSFTQGQVGATYTFTVFNAAAGGPVFAGNHGDGVDTLPAGMPATAISGRPGACTLATLTCTRSDCLSPRRQLFQITLTVNVAANAVRVLVNSVTVSGGGQVNTGQRYRH